MGHGINGKRIHMWSNEREIVQNTHEETRTRMKNTHVEEIFFFFQVIVFVYLFVHIFDYECNVFKL